MTPPNLLEWALGKNYPQAKSYRREFLCGRVYEPIVGAWLANHGIDVVMAPASDVETRAQLKQGVDILAGGYRVEVKSRGFDKLPLLTKLENVAAWHHRKDPPDIYVVISRTTLQMLWTPACDPGQWVKKKSYDDMWYFARRDSFSPITTLPQLILEHPRT